MPAEAASGTRVGVPIGEKLVPTTFPVLGSIYALALTGPTPPLRLYPVPFSAFRFPGYLWTPSAAPTFTPAEYPPEI